MLYLTHPFVPCSPPRTCILSLTLLGRDRGYCLSEKYNPGINGRLI